MPQSSLTAWLDRGRLPVSLPEKCSVVSSAPQAAPPPQFDLRHCVKDDLPWLKRLNGLLLPIPYPQSFYSEIINDQVANSITLVAVWHDDAGTGDRKGGKLVGAMRCRLFPDPLVPSSRGGPVLYISTLAVYAPYRAHGIATMMLNALAKEAVEKYAITGICAHVWEANLDGLEWYRKRGFQQVSQDPAYYRQLNPRGAIIMQREAGVLDAIGLTNTPLIEPAQSRRT
ncbi:acyl-CoA N-acyltransferase [Piedraia hortae CBS 480.64]|uniref:Acyl-CoA N-acyltransferase n=1 Tax=Piedraia hortae CBS 480.64 TaxID=1314780 RepID=A0A6A7BQX0_9PEZI|nr:acyl-CoA N-acyltransferase [Piedraia hortae CBS 480.64]